MLFVQGYVAPLCVWNLQVFACRTSRCLLTKEGETKEGETQRSHEGWLRPTQALHLRGGVCTPCQRTTLTDMALAWALPTPADTLTPILPLAEASAPVTMRALFDEFVLS